MSGVAKQVGKLFGGGSSSTPAQTPKEAAQTPKEAAAKPRVASSEERSLALRRRRGSRTLLSEERMNSETGLGGDQTTLGGT